MKLARNLLDFKTPLSIPLVTASPPAKAGPTEGSSGQSGSGSQPQLRRGGRVRQCMEQAARLLGGIPGHGAARTPSPPPSPLCYKPVRPANQARRGRRGGGPPLSILLVQFRFRKIQGSHLKSVKLGPLPPPLLPLCIVDPAQPNRRRGGFQGGGR